MHGPAKTQRRENVYRLRPLMTYQYPHTYKHRHNFWFNPGQASKQARVPSPPPASLPSLFRHVLDVPTATKPKPRSTRARRRRPSLLWCFLRQHVAPPLLRPSSRGAFLEEVSKEEVNLSPPLPPHAPPFYFDQLLVLTSKRIFSSIVFVSSISPDPRRSCSFDSPPLFPFPFPPTAGKHTSRHRHHLFLLPPPPVERPRPGSSTLRLLILLHHLPTTAPTFSSTTTTTTLPSLLLLHLYLKRRPLRLLPPAIPHHIQRKRTPRHQPLPNSHPRVPSQRP